MAMDRWVETLRGMAFPMHCDHMNHVNNRWYSHFFDDASLSLWSHFGLTEKALRERFNTSAVIAHTQIDFLKELVASDQFIIRSALTTIGKTSLTLQSELFHIDEELLCARQTMIAVFFNDKTRSSQPVPNAIREILEPVIVDAHER
ncbi:MAG: hypothetical protein CMM56_00590 [Rhodospirillaceae bacterium]|nr:hypothetical protein [Rhodospirillaceae bacterium]